MGFALIPGCASYVTAEGREALRFLWFGLGLLTTSRSRSSAGSFLNVGGFSPHPAAWIARRPIITT